MAKKQSSSLSSLLSNPKNILVIILLVAASAFFVGANKGNLGLYDNNASEVADETANWKTYVNNRYKYSLKYPENVVLEEKSFKGATMGKDEILNTFKVAGGSLEIKGNAGGMGISPKRIEDITIAGIETDKYYITDTNIVIKAIHSPNGDDIYFSVKLSQDSVKAKEVDSLFEQILSTFKFTN